MKKAGSTIFNSSFLFSLFILFLSVDQPSHHGSSAYQHPVLQKDQVHWLNNTINPQRDSDPLSPEDKPVNMALQPDDDDGNHIFPVLPGGRPSRQLSLFAFSVAAYPVVHQDISLPPPKV